MAIALIIITSRYVLILLLTLLFPSINRVTICTATPNLTFVNHSLATTISKCGSPQGSRRPLAQDAAGAVPRQVDASRDGRLLLRAPGDPSMAHGQL